MRYRIEAIPGKPDVVRIRVDRRLIQGLEVKYPRDASKTRGERLSEGLVTFLTAVLDMDGVEQEIRVFRYELRIVKAELYSWKSILPYVIVALRYFIGNEGGQIKIKKELTS